jgi:SAM-dependent methyltransferase/methyltransferase-like protein
MLGDHGSPAEPLGYRFDLEQYDSLGYDDFPFRATHPDWLSMAGRMLGVSTPRADRASVLELGCGRGANLVGLALALPDAEFLGIDAAEAQIADGRADAEALGLRNLTFSAGDIASNEVNRVIDDLSERGTFDYIICHGVYSWVPGAVRTRIVELISTRLAPGGIGYISFNTLPGWHARGLVRDVLRRVAIGSEAADRATSARSFLDLWSRHLGADQALGDYLRGEMDLLGRLSDRYLFFEHLVEENTAFYLEDFVGTVRSAGLEYLGDADLGTMRPEQLGDEAAEEIGRLGLGPVGVEALLDLLTVRLFRRALLCRAEDVGSFSDERPLHDAWLQADLDVAGLQVDLMAPASVVATIEDGSHEPGEASHVEVELRDDTGSLLSSDDPVVTVALWIMSEMRPVGQDLERLTRLVAERLGRTVDPDLIEEVHHAMEALVLHGRVDAGRVDRGTTHLIEDRPITSRLVRRQASAARAYATTSRHDHLALDRLDHVLLPLLDGEHGRTELLAAALSALGSEKLEITVDDRSLEGSAEDADLLVEIIDEKLEQYRRVGLLLRGDSDPRRWASNH